MSTADKPRKQLPWWVEPLLIGAFVVTAWIEWGRGERFWAAFFMVAALLFGITGAIFRRKK